MERDEEPFAGLDPAHRKGPGLTGDQITALETALGRSLPSDYRAFLHWGDGWEGFHGEAYLALYRANDLPFTNDNDFRAAFPGVVAIGGDGGLETFALDYRVETSTPGVVALDRNSADVDDVLSVADGFRAALSAFAAGWAVLD